MNLHRFFYAKELIHEYYRTFNSGNIRGMVDLLHHDVVHEINQGNVETGRDRFYAFLKKMSECYEERVDDLRIGTYDDGGNRFCAEFVVTGQYRKTDPGFPEATGQKYLIRCGVFFEIAEDKISRVTNYYNVFAWKKQVEPFGKGITVLRVQGKDILPYIDDLARLRISVFRDYPYLYDGSYEYEKDYLSVYAASPFATIVLAMKDKSVVGASTAIPLEDENDYIRTPFVEAGFDPHEVFYFGESVLDKTFRGIGIGFRFFIERELSALALPDIKYTAFCAVIRPENHPLKPVNYRSLDSFWLRMGYGKAPHLQAQFSWKEIHEDQESMKPMQYWLKSWKRFS